MAGLNDNFLIADDSMEPKDAPAVTLNVFKDTTDEEGTPELREDIDLVAIATEELEITLRDLNLLEETIKGQGGMSRSVALEAHAIIPDFLSDDRPAEYFTVTPSRTFLKAALEDIDNQKKSVLEKIWDFIINLLKKILLAFVKFMTGIDLEAEAKIAKEAADIVKNKEKENIDFVEDVIKKINKTNLAVISAIEEDEDFITTYNENLEHDKQIKIPNSSYQIGDITRNSKAADFIIAGLDKLSSAIATAEAKPDEDRDAKLRKTLTDGLSINGAENAAYLKAFAGKAEGKKRYEHMIEAAEKMKAEYASDSVLESMRKVATALSKQFSMEVRVVGAYVNFNKAVISVNNKIHQSPKWSIST